MLSAASQELLDISQQRVNVPGPEHVIVARIFDEFGARYLLDEILACRDWDLEVPLCDEAPASGLEWRAESAGHRFERSIA
jgi:hypothetical protein